MMMGYSVLFTFTPESFSPTIRSLGVGTSQFFGKISATLCPVFIGWLLTLGSEIQLSVLVFCAFLFLSAGLAFLVTETKPDIKEDALLKEV